MMVNPPFLFIKLITVKFDAVVLKIIRSDFVVIIEIMIEIKAKFSVRFG